MTNFDSNTSELTLQWLTDPCRYDRWSRPPNNGLATNISVRIYIYFLGSVEAQNLHFTAHALIRYRWVDSRLSRNSTRVIQAENLITDRLWIPHLYIVNEHESQVMGSGQQDVLVTVEPAGTVLYSARLKVTLLCLMKLQKFPFDEQRCPLILESWAYNSTDLILDWEANSPVVVNNQLHMTEYNLVAVKTNSSFAVYSLPENVCDRCVDNHYFGKFAGNYSCLTVYFYLEREVGHYIMDYYVPSILLVMVSWVSFWLDPNAVPGRTVLGTSTMLTFITLSRNIGSSLPKVSYIKATEIWFIVCTGFIFGSLVEFAFVNTIWRRKNDFELKKVTGKHVLRATLTPQLNRRTLSELSADSLPSLKRIHANRVKFHKSNSAFSLGSTDTISADPKAYTIDEHSNERQEEPPRNFLTMTPQQIAQWIDRRSRLIFPIAFFAFNCVYWIFVYI